MKFQMLFVPVAILVSVVWSFYAYGFKGLLVSVGVLSVWFLLHWTRTMQVLRRAAERPIGYVASAVMLNAKLKPGVTLLHVVAMTRALGELRSVRRRGATGPVPADGKPARDPGAHAAQPQGSAPLAAGLAAPDGGAGPLGGALTPGVG